MTLVRTASFFLALPLVLSCNSQLLAGGGDPGACPEGTACPDPNKPPGKQETTTRFGGMGGMPFEPTQDGSTGVIVDPQGNVILDPKGAMNTMASIMWVANSGDGTLSKIDARTMKQIARYVTYPGGVADPSRTTVSLGGDVVVANRAWQNGATPDKASAVKIAGEKSSCIDRNGNGKIDTYEGDGPVPAEFQWKAGQASSPDECVIWLTQLHKDAAGSPVGGIGTLPRAAGYDSIIEDSRLSKYVYVGLFSTSEVIRIDGGNGNIVKRISVAPTQPYGLVLDRNGRVWVQGRESEPGSVAMIDVVNNDAVKRYTGATLPSGNSCNYGITADSRGFIYSAWLDCVARFNPMTETWEAYAVPGAGRLRGLAIDNKQQLWVADDQIGMHHIDASAAPPAAGKPSTLVLKKTIDTRVAGAATGNVGAAIDFDNKPWTISTSNRAVKIDPATYTIAEHTAVRGSYTYSDMSGYQLRNASRAGTFRHTFTGCTPPARTTWTTLTYGLTASGGARASIRYRAAGSVADLQSAAWVSVTAKSPVPITLPAGAAATYLQVEVTMSSVDATQTPILSELAAGFTCELIVG